jgi:redox-sensitive bicupin YhaK (pirin superfamily)
MAITRAVTHILKSKPAMDGAGVKLMRVFGHSELPSLDPFLLLDEFASTNPQDYLAGFPWHPHRGMETVTYMLNGSAQHEDNLGNTGIIKSGGLQWMSAGSGIIHQEMPKRTDGLLRGMQLWVNLPASHKMAPPNYQDVRQNDVPATELEAGVSAKVIAGKIGKTKGPIHDIVADISYMHFSVTENKEFELPVDKSHNAFAYLLEGKGSFGSGITLEKGSLALFGKGESIPAKSTNTPLDFLLVTGKPLNEPIAWAGPIVMNTDEELETAYSELQNGTFIKGKPKTKLI